jgi:glycosyltransferase involved in cell wall biosynthesis
MLPYFIRHYDPFVDGFVIIDDGSTDGSIEFLKDQSKVKLIMANRKEASYIEQSRVFFNEAWKESRSVADWIITCNIDEHIYHKNMEVYLQYCRQHGVTVLPAQGYEMVALTFPSNQGRLCDEVRLGAQTQRLTGPSSMLNKIMVFNPQAIEEINFDIGRHSADPTGRVVYPNSIELKMLHYKFLGLKYANQRYAELKAGLSSNDIKHGLGIQYISNTSKVQRTYESIIAVAHVVVPAGLIRDAKLNLSFLPLRIKFHLLDHIVKHHHHPIVRILLSILNAVKRFISLNWFKR